MKSVDTGIVGPASRRQPLDKEVHIANGSILEDNNREIDRSLDEFLKDEHV